tara:strand:- start:1969 stop:2568 length:600 start_codon:yes stop_codon:yes gene_type:complete
LKNSLLLGTSNASKLQEFIFYIEHFSLFKNFQIHDLTSFKDLGEPIEDGKTFEDNAEIKSKYFLKKTNCLVLSDDSGFIVDDLKDYPGINTARETRKMGGEQKVIDFIFTKFENLNYVDACFFCSICIFGKEEKLNVSGSIPGFIINERRGINGFGYDPYFIPRNSNKTFAEMDKKQKLLSSHRFKAFEKLSTQILQGN